jgi:hypothetical protein
MLTEELIKNRFIVEVLTADLDRLKSAQLSRLHEAPADVRRHFDIPDVAAALQSQTRNITATASGVVITERIDKRLRYLDMRRLGNQRIYNRILFPLIYRSAFARIHYGFTEEVRRQIRDRLADAYKPLNP